MSEIVNRMAQAMAEADGISGADPERVREVFEPLVRAALGAMRDPTAAMIAAGWSASGIRAAYTAMIDEALKVSA